MNDETLESGHWTWEISAAEPPIVEQTGQTMIFATEVGTGI